MLFVRSEALCREGFVINGHISVGVEDDVNGSRQFELASGAARHREMLFERDAAIAVIDLFRSRDIAMIGISGCSGAGQAAGVLMDLECIPVVLDDDDMQIAGNGNILSAARIGERDIKGHIRLRCFCGRGLRMHEQECQYRNSGDE